MIVHNPESIAKPRGAYSHGIEVPAGQRLLFVSGQLGYAADGRLPATFEEQADRVWQNIGEVLKAAGMQFSDIVKMSTLVVRPEDYVAARSFRAKYLGEHRPASTAVVVSRLTSPDNLIEIEVMAAA